VLYGTKLGIDNLGLYFVVYALCLLVTRPLYGRLADTFGAERVLVPGVVFFAISYVMLAHITDFAGLMAVAVVASAGFGACMPLTQSLAMSSVPTERRGAASNTTFTGLDVGSLCGPLFAGLVIEMLEPVTGSLISAYSTMWLVMLVPMAIAFVVIIYWNVKK
jgi:MFS family permease